MNESETISVIGLLERFAPMAYTVLGVGLGFSLTWVRDKWVRRSRRKNYLLPVLKLIDVEMVRAEENYERTSDMRMKAIDLLEDAMDSYSTAPTPQTLRRMIEGLTHLTDIGHLRVETAMDRAFTGRQYLLLVEELVGRADKDIDSLNLQYPDRNSTSETSGHA